MSLRKANVMVFAWRIVLSFVLLVCCASCSPKKLPQQPLQTSGGLQQLPPATEGRRLKGWQNPYQVYGVSYTPLLCHEGFVEQGLASWYGEKFHGRKTSNGEIYDMYAMTAAHKTLPLGVFVRVDNHANGRSQVVRVNDRGPFIAGRIIDLSFTAASNLGVVGPGTAPVTVTALGYQSIAADGSISYTLPQSIDNGPFTVQVGAFTQYANAQRLQGELLQRYGAADIRQVEINSQTFYRVRAGKYTSIAQAFSGQQSLSSAGYGSGFIVAID